MTKAIYNSATNRSRRALIAAPLVCLAASVIPACTPRSDVERRLQALEQSAGGRLGVCLLDTTAGDIDGYRQDERFALCSTFKLPLAALILREIDAGRLAPDEFVSFGEDDIVSWAPVTSKKLEEGGMPLIELAEAAQVISDNVAANLLLQKMGGPAGFTDALRKLGDQTTRLDRSEPALNSVAAGELRDTTTPCAMSATVSRLLTGNELSDQSRHVLTGWMRGTRTGAKRLRAGLPSQWSVGNKTGSSWGGDIPNKYNDVAVAWPDDKNMYVIAAYYEADGAYERMRDSDQAVLAEVGRIAAYWIGT